ncbi:WRKY transcription factor 19 [Globisporangium polare]
MSRRHSPIAAAGRLARVHNHHQLYLDGGLAPADVGDPLNANEHPKDSDKLTLNFILSNRAARAADVPAASAVRQADLVCGVGLCQLQPYAPMPVVETVYARVRSYGSASPSSFPGPTMANYANSRSRAARSVKDSPSFHVSSLIQGVEMNSPATGRCTRDSAGTAAASVERSKLEKKRGRMCKTEGCKNYIVHKGLCCRHGGGKKCSIEGCTTSAKHLGLCWKHGGSTECDIDGCTKRAKARRLCWAHGGGTRCTNAECEKVAVTGGLCWAHGGGKRCNFDDCNKPAYERKHNFCTKHHAEMQHVNYFEV